MSNTDNIYVSNTNDNAMTVTGPLDTGHVKDALEVMASKPKIETGF